MGHQKVKRHCAFWAEKGLPYGKSSMKMYLKRQPKSERKSPFIRGFRPFLTGGLRNDVIPNILSSPYIPPAVPL
jgi:hypothetical protein